MLARLIRWALFTVVLALMPFFMTAINLWTDGKINDLLHIWRHGDILWPRGELLLVTTAISADAAGGLVASGKDQNPLIQAIKVASAGGCIILAVGSAWWYQTIQQNTVHLTGRIVMGSGVILAVTLLVSLVCKALAED